MTGTSFLLCSVCCEGVTAGIHGLHPLWTAREAWKEQPIPFMWVVEYVQEMWDHDSMAHPHEFHLSNWVLLLLPNTSKFLALWQGPCMVVEKVGLVNYCLQKPSIIISQQTYHINLLKPWIEPVPILSATLTPHQYWSHLLPNGKISFTWKLQPRPMLCTMT